MNIKKYIKNTGYIYYKLGMLGFWKNTPDDKYLKRIYKILFGCPLNLENPQKFSEKIQWLKLYDRNPKYTMMVDKYLAKEYVSNVLKSDKIIIPTIKVYNSVKEVNFEELPNKFVMKCTHDSGGLVICHDKKNLNYKKSLKKIRKSLKRDFYYCCREWAYKDVEKKIIIEELIEDKNNKDLIDYKFFCFNGEIKFFGIYKNRSTKMETQFFDMNYEFIPVDRGYGISDNQNFQKPDNFDLMLNYVKQLCDGFKFIRVDLYNCNGKIYFGELTFYPNAGLSVTKPEYYDKLWGKYLKLD